MALVINSVFGQLLAAFPAATANREQSEVDEIRRQWVLAFMENGITSMAQVDAGMTVARKQVRPFLPSPGQFVEWCKQSGGALGITVDQVIAEYWDWRNKRAQFYYTLADRLYLTYRAVVHGEYADPDEMLSFDIEAIGEKMLEKLFAELTQIQRKFNGNGKLELMTKVEMKQKLGIPSPNLADALMMCMHCPSRAQEETEIHVPSSSGW